MVRGDQSDIRERMYIISCQLETVDRYLVEARERIRSVIQGVVEDILEDSRKELTSVVEGEVEEQLCKRVRKKADEFLRNLSIEITVL